MIEFLLAIPFVELLQFGFMGLFALLFLAMAGVGVIAMSAEDNSHD